MVEELEKEDLNLVEIYLWRLKSLWKNLLKVEKKLFVTLVPGKMVHLKRWRKNLKYLLV